MDRRKILVVDDNAQILRLLKKWLEDLYDVTIVNSGRDALNALEKKHFDMILLDYEMPNISGYQLLRILRSDARYAKLPVFFLTAMSHKSYIEKVISLKPEGYILKTAKREEIIERIENYFAEQK